jgi:C4-dicarboxylate-specific signal transduction histidine kinase
MGEMASGLAHEINQPLAAIVSFAQGCARRLRANARDVETVLPVIDSIAAEGLRAGEIIRRLRHLIRKQAPRQEWVHLNELVEEVLRIVEPEVRQQGVVLAVSLAATLPRLRGDGIQLEQVVLNLLRNAIEALADVDSGALHVATRARGAGQVELVVRDSGPGVLPALAEQVFEPFFSTKAGGLGMGLSISRTIVESHGGRIALSASPNGGTTVRVTLPVGVAAPAAAAAAG